MAYGWTDPAYAGGSARLDTAVAALQQLLPLARSKSVPIFYTTSVFHEQPQLKSAADFSPNFRRWDRAPATLTNGCGRWPRSTCFKRNTPAPSPERR